MTGVTRMRAMASVLLNRIQYMREHGVTFGGDRRLYDVLGYDEVVTSKQYRDRYTRGGIAKRIVEAMPNATWRGGVRLTEDEDPEKVTTFEQTWDDLDKRLRIVPVLRRADILAGLSTYSVILLGANGSWDTELPKGNADQLLYFAPYLAGGGPGNQSPAAYVDATIQEFEDDASNSRYGLPKMYALKRTTIASTDIAKPVHWSRIIHIAENTLDNEVYGTPTLENVWNLLDDLEKVTGGGAEAFWLRANQGMNLNMDPAATWDEKAMASLTDEVKDYRNNISRILKTRGMDVRMLGSDVANFANPADAILTQISGSKGIPKRILTGSEMGELASSQDRDNWKDQVAGRQSGYAGPFIVQQLADRLISFGYLPTPAKGYTVKFAQIETLTSQERVAGVAGWAAVNASHGAPIFTSAEIRDYWYGLAPLTPEQLAEQDALKPKPEPAPEPPPAAPNAEGADSIQNSSDEPLDSEDEDEDDALPRAAQERFETEMTRVLEAAIRANNTEVIHRIIGVRSLYSEDQARDENGQFASGGGSAGGGSGGERDVTGFGTGPSGGSHTPGAGPGKTAPAKKSEDFHRYVAEHPVNPAGKDTLQKHTMPDGTLSPDRQVLKDELVGEIIDDMVRAPNGDNTTVLLGGGPYIGKSTVIRNMESQLGLPSDPVKVNVDDVRLKIPEYRTLPRAQAAWDTHEEASIIAKVAAAKASAFGANLIIDGTGNKTIETLQEKVDLYRSRSKHVEAHYVTVDTEEAVKRAHIRENDPKSDSYGRHVKPTFIRESHRAISKIFPEAVKRGLFDKFTLWDNTEKQARLVVSGKGKDMVVHNQDLWDRFQAKAYEVPRPPQD